LQLQAIKAFTNSSLPCGLWEARPSSRDPHVLSATTGPLQGWQPPPLPGLPHAISWQIAKKSQPSLGKRRRV